MKKVKSHLLFIGKRYKIIYNFKFFIMVVVVKKVSENYVVNAKEARKSWPGAIVLDPNKGGAMEKLDPSFPIGKVKVPESKWMEALSIMGIWEGLKVFSKKDEVDISFLKDEKKVGKVRGCKSYGKMVGIKLGDRVIEGDEEVKEFFIKLYKDSIGEKFGDLIKGLKELAKKKTVVLLENPGEEGKFPVSHVELLKEMVE